MPLPIRALPSVAHPEAMDWRARVIANGGTVDGMTMSAVSRFCRRIDGIGVRDRFYRLNLFCGDGLEAALVPLYRAESRTAAVRGNATDTNNNFVGADFNNTGASSGLKGDGSTKTLQTGINGNALTASNAHIGFGLRATDTQGAGFFDALGVYNGSSNAYTISLRRNAGTFDTFFTNLSLTSNGAGVSVTPTALAVGDYIASYPSLFQDGVAFGATATASQDYPSAHDIYVFGLNNSNTSIVSRTNARGSWYSIGLAFTTAQVAAVDSAIKEFHTALSRT